MQEAGVVAEDVVVDVVVVVVGVVTDVVVVTMDTVVVTVVAELMNCWIGGDVTSAAGVVLIPNF